LLKEPRIVVDNIPITLIMALRGALECNRLVTTGNKAGTWNGSLVFLRVAYKRPFQAFRNAQPLAAISASLTGCQSCQWFSRCILKTIIAKIPSSRAGNRRSEDSRIVRHATHTNQTSGIRWLPGLDTLRQYESSWLRHDLVAGLVMTTMLVPVGIAYAEASGVPGINGLYATIVPLLAYALFGPSRILVLGPDLALAPVILAVVLPLSAGDPQRAVALAGMTAIVSGVVCVGAGLARLGFITELLSKPIRYGHMNGIALTVLLS